MQQITSSSYQFDRFGQQAQAQEIQRLEYKSRILQGMEARIWRNAGLTATMQVLDLGCGPGIVSQAIAQTLTSGSIIGIDRSPAMIAAAQSCIQPSQLTNLTFQVGDSENLSLPTASCDFVYARFLFQHLGNPQVTLAEIRRVLRPGGIVCIVDIDSDWMMFYPPLASTDTFQQQVIKMQQQQGGDRMVGRKLGDYLTAAGFGQVQTTIEVVTSDLDVAGERLGLKAFLDLFSFGAAFQHDHPEAIALGAKVKADAAKLLDLPYAWAGFGLFAVVGIKQKNSF
jgi:ubiquinone/menaquinone biosynthesis C-methylase UbiE